MVELKLNGSQVELPKNVSIKHTLQVHDIADVSSVNASYTNSFDLPKSPNNTHLMDGLGVAGDTSVVPYTRVNSELSVGGIPLIINGWLDVKSTSDKYKVSIIDGIIDLFKAIENKRFGVDIPIQEIEHDKNMTTVVDSFTNENYRYIIGDFGGHNVVFSGFPGLYYYNIDYLVPFVRVKYLWNKIFEFTNFTYSGSIFEHEDFENAWISYPKSTNAITEDKILEMDLVYMPSMGFNLKASFIWNNNEWVLVINPTISDPPEFEGNFLIPDKLELEPYPQYGGFQKIKVLENGSYNIHIDFDVDAEYVFRALPIGTVRKTLPVKLKILKNGNFQNVVMHTDNNPVVTFTAVAGDIIDYQVVLMDMGEINSYLNSINEDPLPPYIVEIKGATKLTVNNWTMEVNDVNFAEFTFEDALKDLTPRDLLKEVMTRFGLTPIPSKYENHVDFYKIDELLDIENSEDWSDKYMGRTNEVYTYNGYAQSNEFKHKYTQEAVNYNDGRLIVSNQNLDEIKALYSSKFYSPEQNIIPLNLGGYLFNIHQTLIWDQEVKEDDDGEIVITYKGGTGRFYWVKQELTEGTLTLVSEVTGGSETIYEYPLLNTHMTTYSDLIPTYYEKYNQLLNNTRIHEIELKLTIADILSLDFTKPKYFEQEQSYYKLNKIIFEEGKLSKGEFIKLNPTING